MTTGAVLAAGVLNVNPLAETDGVPVMISPCRIFPTKDTATPQTSEGDFL
jgi:hypothetical protein